MTGNNYSEKLNKIQKFFYDENFQNDLGKLSTHLLPINVLDISGMGSQEIKHSNVLAWMFGDNQHLLGHTVLEKFLAHTARIDGDNNENENLRSLRHYAYFPEKERKIQIKREWKNIDLVIEDNANKTVIVIENKVWADESEHQITKYEKAINQHYFQDKTNEQWTIYFIFLTPTGVGVKNADIEETWLTATYQDIYNIIDSLIKSNRDLQAETKFILESYNDLLVKEGILMHKELQILCREIWKKHKEELDILLENRPDNIDAISDIILKRLVDELGADEKSIKKRQKKGHIFRFSTKETKPYDFEFYLEFSKSGIYLGIQKASKESTINFKQAHENQSCQFNDREKWKEYIDTPTFESSNYSEEIDKKMIPVIEKIKKWEKLVTQDST